MRRAIFRLVRAEDFWPARRPSAGTGTGSLQAWEPVPSPAYYWPFEIDPAGICTAIAESFITSPPPCTRKCCVSAGRPALLLGAFQKL